MDINKAIRETRDNIVSVLNGSGLPIEVLRLILGEIQNAASNQALEEAKQEKKEQENAVN